MGHCSLCLGINDNLCIDCLENEVTAWLADFRPTLIPLLRDRTDNFDIFLESASQCLSCGQKATFCASCYKNAITTWLDTELPERIPDFNRSFRLERPV